MKASGRQCPFSSRSTECAGFLTRQTHSGTAAMISFSNRAGRLAFCAMLAATATLTATKSFAAPHYDGTWSVLVVTEKGTCDPAYRYPIRIANGTLLNAGDTAFTVTG